MVPSTQYCLCNKNRVAEPGQEGGGLDLSNQITVYTRWTWPASRLYCLEIISSPAVLACKDIDQENIYVITFAAQVRFLKKQKRSE
jgi:hypothetical protein